MAWCAPRLGPVLDAESASSQVGLVKVVKISDAKNNLSRHLEYVRKGGRIRIMDRDRPVADLIPLEPSASGSDDAIFLADLERRGLVRRGRPVALPAELLRPGPVGPDAGVLAALLDERSQSR